MTPEPPQESLNLTGSKLTAIRPSEQGAILSFEGDPHNTGTVTTYHLAVGFGFSLELPPGVEPNLTNIMRYPPRPVVTARGHYGALPAELDTPTPADMRPALYQLVTKTTSVEGSTGFMLLLGEEWLLIFTEAGLQLCVREPHGTSPGNIPAGN